MIYQYSRYDLNTGRFTGQGSNPDQDNVLSKLGRGLIEGHYDHASQMVENGAVVLIPDETLEQEQIEKAWDDLRPDRNRRLQSTDWTQVADAPVDSVEWALYRQDLRDLPSNTTDPRNPLWPTPPEM
jgi:hypothetical protein